MKILVVDDEKLLVKGIKFNLENEGYDVDVCYDGATAVQMAAQGGYDLIILDLMMPGLDGLEACQRIRQTSTVPIIMLTAKSEDADKLLGFESGADDYITKPFNILELKARIRALLRRAGIAAAQPGAQSSAHILEHGGVTLDTEKRTAYKHGSARVRPRGAVPSQPRQGVQPRQPAGSGLGLRLPGRRAHGGRAHTQTA